LIRLTAWLRHAIFLLPSFGTLSGLGGSAAGRTRSAHARRTGAEFGEQWKYIAEMVGYYPSW
jgi:hypothetical protein